MIKQQRDSFQMKPSMQRAPALRQSLIDRFGTQATNALAMTHPEMASAEGMGEMMFQEGKNNPDYIEARSDPSYLGEGRKPFMSAISAWHEVNKE